VHKRISREMGRKKGVAIAESNIGNIHQKMGEYEKALSCYEVLEKISKEIGDRMGVSIALNNMGSVYLDMGEYEKALGYFKQDMAICSDSGNKHGLAETLASIALVHFENGETEAALTQANRAIELYRDMDIASHAYLESLFIKAESLRLQHQADGARQINQEARGLAKKISNREYMLKTALQSHVLQAVSARQEAIDSLLAMAGNDMPAAIKADIYYELFILEKADAYRKSAIALYETAYTSIPKYRYRKRISELQEYAQ